MERDVVQELREFEADHVWVHENLETLLGRYERQWVAVKNRRVIAGDRDLSRLRAKLQDPAHTCVEFVTCEPVGTVL